MFVDLSEVILGPSVILPSSLEMLPSVLSMSSAVPLAHTLSPSNLKCRYIPLMQSDLFLNLAFIYFSGFMPGSRCFEDDSFMGHFNPGLFKVPGSPESQGGEGRERGLGMSRERAICTR